MIMMKGKQFTCCQKTFVSLSANRPTVYVNSAGDNGAPQHRHSLIGKKISCRCIGGVGGGIISVFDDVFSGFRLCSDTFFRAFFN